MTSVVLFFLVWGGIAWLLSGPCLRRCLRVGCLGVMPNAGLLLEEAARAARLRQLGAAGTLRVYNCGKILHVDYERGALIIEREDGG